MKEERAMTSRCFRSALAIAVLAAGSVSCGDEDHGTVQLAEAPGPLPEVMNVEYTFAKATVEVTPEETETAVLSLQPAGGALLLKGDSELAAAAEEGQVLLFGQTSHSPDGALLKVTSKIVLEDGTVALETEPAMLEEAFDELHIELVRHARYEEIESYDTKIDGLGIKRGAVSSLYAGYSEFGGELFSVSFPPIVIWDADFSPSTTTDQVTVGGDLNVGMTLMFDVDIGIFLQLYHLKVGAKVWQESELDFMAKVALANKSGSKSLATLHLGSFWAGPVLLKVSLELFLAWEVGVFGTIETKVTSKTSFAVGVDYRNYGDANDGFNPFYEMDSDFDYTEPKLGIEALAKISAGAKLAVKLYGMSGPYVQADFYIQLVTGIKQTVSKLLPYWKLQWGLEAYVGFEGSFFGVTLFDWASPELLGWIFGGGNPFPQTIAESKDKSTDPSCISDCSGRHCGLDPVCFRVCPPGCAVGVSCVEGQCYYPCGNGVCEPSEGETIENCSDCPPICGDGKCSMPVEHEGNCLEDCMDPCGDQFCDSAAGEHACNCSDDCGECCGNGKCRSGEWCDTCPQDCGPCCPNGFCEESETCLSCQADCGQCCPNGQCASDESCTSCPEDCGLCCGDGTCEAALGENCESCAADCKPCCGNGICDEPLGESCTKCPQDCGTCCGDGKCSNGEDCTLCAKDCGSCCGNGTCDAGAGESHCTCPADCEDDPASCSACECGESGESGESCSCDPTCGVTGDCCVNVCQGCGTCVVCGDGECVGQESCKNCPADCGACCGNGSCEPQQNESSCSCPADCPDDPNTCSPCQCGGSGGDCDCGPSCVADGTCCANACSLCGSCPAVCDDGKCEATESCDSCSADCGQCCGDGTCDSALGEDSCSCPKDCLDDPNACSPCQCGGSGGSCWCDAACQLTGSCCADACETCGACPATCGDGDCEAGEDCKGCSEDCGECCGNEVCEAKHGETPCTCPDDCKNDPGSCSPCECAVGGEVVGCSCQPGCAEAGDCCANACTLCGVCPAVCGDKTCNGDETCESCPLDCGECCGNGICEAVQAEDSCSCPEDCADDPASCSACECGQPSGGDCGCDAACVAGDTCCGNTCQACGFCAPDCGDGQCNGEETCQTCPKDCGECCGNGVCDPGYGEDSCSCPTECPDDPGSCSACQCGASGGVCSCAPDCVAKGTCCEDSCDGCGICPPICGDNICNGDETSCSCPGDCPDDPYTCSSCQCGGTGGACDCSEACILAGNCCPDSCDACGYCPPECEDTKCEVDKGETVCSCPADCGDPCAGLACGVDPVCGTSCGTCPTGQECEAGVCELQCGNNTCDPGETQCTCPGDCGSPCATVECGSEPVCGDDCGQCAGGLACDGGKCVEWCGDTFCTGDETKCNCPEDCGDPCANVQAASCGSDPTCGKTLCGIEPVCGQNCGACPSGGHCFKPFTGASWCMKPYCGDGKCEKDECCDQDCGPACAGQQCGFASCPPYWKECGDEYSLCGGGKECNGNTCVTAGKCGNGTCDASAKETACNCPKDCGTCNGCCEYGTDICHKFSQMAKAGPLCGFGLANAGSPCGRCNTSETAWGQWCVDGACVKKCGDGVCNDAWETRCSCPADCGVCDGCCQWVLPLNEGVDKYCRSPAQQGPAGCGQGGKACATCAGETPVCEEGACVAK